MNTIKTFFAAILVLTSITANASSLVPSLEIDFRASDWNSAFGLNTYTYDGVTLSTQPTTKTIFQNRIDGIGILGGEPDEINPGEMMNIGFDYSTSWASALTGVWITDLFDFPDGGINGEEGLLQLTLADGTIIDFSFFGKNSDQANGEQYIDFGTELKVATANFKTNGIAGHEFSIAGFTAVPEATSITMFILGFLLLGFMRRGRKS